MNAKKLSQGFTLIEMMVAVAIIAILAVIAIPMYSDYIERGQLTAAKQVAIATQQSLEANRLARPRDFQTVDKFKAEIEVAYAKVKTSDTDKLYDFKYTVFPETGVPSGFSIEAKPKSTNKGKKYLLKVDGSGKAQRCLIKTPTDCTKL